MARAGKRRIVIGVCCGLALLVAAAVLPLPVFVNKTIPGAYASTDCAPSAPLTLTLQGVYCRYLLRDNVFSGEITLSGLDGRGDITALNKTVSLTRFRGESAAAVSFGSLMYSDAADNRIHPFGMIFTSENLDQIIFATTFDFYKSAEETQTLAFPAGTGYEAWVIATGILGESWIPITRPTPPITPTTKSTPTE